jgi:BirA family transcriptional regulator, biotin operon repressor / biotin---[acetyl-CoA-carboxylase] ligase
MTGLPLDLTPDAIQAHLTTRTFGRAARVVGAVPSTNDLAMAAGQAGAPEGLCILADRQTGGRGRRGRGWESPVGLGLYASILVRSSLPAPRIPLITLAAGLAAVDAIQHVTSAIPRLKWPNDVLLEGRKVAGILTETATVGSRMSHAVIGLGINVHQTLGDFPEALQESATSLGLATGARVERAELAASLFNAFERWYVMLEAGEARKLLDAGRRASATLGRAVQVLAGETWRGTALDLDDDGALLVRDEAGVIRRVLSDDVSIRVPAEASHEP